METVKRTPRREQRRDRATVRTVYTGGRVVRGPALALPVGATRLGRAPQGASVVALPDDPLLSRSHAVLHWTGTALRITDDESRNGTEVGGKPIDQAVLADGDVIRIGDSFLVVRVGPEGTEEPPWEELDGDAPAMGRLRALLRTVADSDATVLLLGETGVGKGQSARAIHRMSGRKGPFVAVNCAAIPEGLAESVLFGHRAGAFTGATTEEAGYFRAASGGTLFIDEIGELPEPLQAKLLHAVEEGAVSPLGSTRAVPIDTRLVAATNASVTEMVREGRFRADLYARLAQIVVELPPLRERREDVLPLLDRFLPAGSPSLDPDLVQVLLLRRWPFNVRELRNTALELSVRGRGLGSLGPDLLGPNPLDEVEAEVPAAAGGPPDVETLRALLSTHQGVVSDVARALGTSRKQVYRWLTRHGLDPSRWR